jgi:hypothetical protein
MTSPVSHSEWIAFAEAEYKKNKFRCGKTEDPKAARAVLDSIHQQVLTLINKAFDVNKLPRTVLDMQLYLEAHPEEQELTQDDLEQLEALPGPIRDRLKSLLKIAA